MMRRRWSALKIVFPLLAGLALATCETTTNIELLRVDATGLLFGVVYLDTNGNEVLDGADALMPNVTVVLSSGRGATLDEVVTDTLGAFRVLDVPVGTYQLLLESESLGDSLQLYQPDGEDVTISRGDTTRIDFGTTFPTLSVEEVLAAEPGRRVITTGISLNARVPFGDGRVHIKGEQRSLRAIGVSRAGINAGDSVRLEGRTALNAGEPVLENVTPVLLVGQAQLPVPEETGTGVAAHADGGELDAALLRVRSADITDTATVNGDFVATIDDGTGPLDLVFKSYLQIASSSFPPDSVIRIDQAVGLLVPYIGTSGAKRWRLLPRGGTDVTLTVKTVDLALTMAVDDGVGIGGDEVNFTIALQNRGGKPATGVQVVDSLPVGLALLSSSTTRGSYSSATGRWTLGDVGSTDADTLRLKARVTTGVLGQITNAARIDQLVNEVDIDPSNNFATAGVTAVAQIDADMSVEVSANANTVLSGDTVTLTILTINNGPFRATGVTIADTLPAGLTLIDSSPSRGTYDAATGFWALDTVKAGTSEQLRIRARATSPTAGTVQNRAWIRPLQNETDAVIANDSSAVTITIQISSQESPEPAAEAGEGSVVMSEGGGDQLGSAWSTAGLRSRAISSANSIASSSESSNGTVMRTNASSVRRLSAASRSRSSLTRYSLWATRPRPWYQ